jgi:hypothetical protein
VTSVFINRVERKCFATGGSSREFVDVHAEGNARSRSRWGGGRGHGLLMELGSEAVDARATKETVVSDIGRSKICGREVAVLEGRGKVCITRMTEVDVEFFDKMAATNLRSREASGTQALGSDWYGRVGWGDGGRECEWGRR